MAAVLNEASFEKKLSTVSNTQDGIQTLSLWMIHHKIHYQKIVDIWLKTLKLAKMSHRLTLYNLANDVIQNSRRKGFTKYVEAFGEVLKFATPLVRDDKVLPSVQRIYRIWEERSIYDSDLIQDLNKLLEKNASAEKVVADFKFNEMAEQIRLMNKTNLDVKAKLQVIKNMKVDTSSLEALSALKDRTMGQQVSTDFEETIQCLEQYVALLSNAVKQRKLLLEALEEAAIYYDSQRSEAKIVANAYKNFGGRIRNLRKKLQEKLKMLPSPVASPNPNAPSPSPSESEDLFTDQTDHKGGESPPSPVGTPEELNFSPEIELAKMQTTATLPDTTIAIAPATVFNPPISDKPNQSTSSNESAPVQSQTSGSLDSRLTNLMENMQKLPAGVLSTLFGKGKSDIVEEKNGSPVVSGTPLTDEPSGHETPLQDEATPESGTENQPNQGFPLTTLVSNNNDSQNWPQNGSQSDWSAELPGPATYPWNPYSDKDERISANVLPMDMDLDDEMEDAPGAIIEGSTERNSFLSDVQPSNLITVVNSEIESNPVQPSDPKPEVKPADVKVPDVQKSDDLEALENDNKIFQETRRQQVLASNTHELKHNETNDNFPEPNMQKNFSNSNVQNNFMNNDRPPYFASRPPRNEFRMYQNDWGNNYNRPRRPMFRGMQRGGMNHPRPYRLPPPPRWPY